MRTFTDAERKLIRKHINQPPQSVLQIKKPCLTHSVCNPLPLFRIYKLDDSTFEAEWNGYHEPGVKQIFRFENVNQ